MTLNSELTKLPKELAEYAILHELIRLIAPNHGKTFKALLSAYMPNREELHKKLVSFFKVRKTTIGLLLKVL